MRRILVFLFMMLPFTLLACPFCASDTATEIRAQILGSDFIENLLAGLSPFVVFALITGLVYKSAKNLK